MPAPAWLAAAITMWELEEASGAQRQSQPGNAIPLADNNTVPKLTTAKVGSGAGPMAGSDFLGRASANGVTRLDPSIENYVVVGGWFKMDTDPAIAAGRLMGVWGTAHAQQQWYLITTGNVGSSSRFQAGLLLADDSTVLAHNSANNSLVNSTWYFAAIVIRTNGSNLSGIRMYFNGDWVAAETTAAQLPNTVTVDPQFIVGWMGGTFGTNCNHDQLFIIAEDGAVPADIEDALDFLFNSGVGLTYAQAIAPPIDPPGAFDLESPGYDDDGISTTPTLRCGHAEDATAYGFTVSLFRDLSSPAVSATGLTSPEYTVPAGTLDNRATYYWKATATNAGGSTDSTSHGVFITAALTVADEPPCRVWNAAAGTEMVRAVRAGEACIGVIALADSRWAFNTTRGDSGGISLGFEKQKIFKVASAPIQYLLVNDGNNRPAFRDEAVEGSALVDMIGDYAAATAGLKPWLPYNADGTLDARIQLVLDVEPVYFNNTAETAGASRVTIAHPSADSVYGHDITERVRVYFPHVKGPGMGSHPYRVRGEAGSPSYATYLSGTLNHSAATFGFDPGYVGEIENGTVDPSHDGLQLCPFDVNEVPTGEGVVFGGILTYPGRGCGYVIGGASTVGGTSLYKHRIGWEALDLEYIKAWIRCYEIAMEGRDWYLSPWFMHGLNCRGEAAPHNTAPGYRDNGKAVLAILEAAIGELRSEGFLTNMLGMVPVFGVVSSSIQDTVDAGQVSANENATLDFCIAGARMIADDRGDTVVIDSRRSWTANTTALLSDDAHLEEKASYETACIGLVSRFFLACEMAGELVGVAA